ncbi:MAG TPA: protein-disulfide reductase DsbD [Noviherbaspirillum sp.]|nr:protein-disulfide reductase DsbD [Noviherbaspirillum sp.]
MFKLFNQSVQRGWSSQIAIGILTLFSVFFSAVSSAEDDFLQPEQAFQFSAKMVDAKTAEVRYKIADGYYMYREHFLFTTEGATLGEPVIPPGEIKFDETFQKNVASHRGVLTITLPVEEGGKFTLNVTSQGCADKGLCYAPMTSTAYLTHKSADSIVSMRGQDLATGITPQAMFAEAEAGGIEASLKSGRLLVILPLFLLLGLGLSLTPCVLPMVPILSSIIVGEGSHVSRIRGFTLSVSYSLGMALVYTGLGIAAGLIGEGLAASLQNPWVLGAFALLMVLLSLSMFGLYQIQVPAILQARLANASGQQAAGKLLGVFVMGAISALIVGPCVAAPLAGALVYISQTRNVITGGSALFAMAVGMSVPLLLVGVSASALLPRTGRWMNSLKHFFGVLMLGLALWIVSPVISARLVMLGWATLGIGYGGYLLRNRQRVWMTTVAALFIAMLGMVQLVGVATGGQDALAPVGHLIGGANNKVEFKQVKSVADLDIAVTQANGKIVMLDFYADWCVSCIEMEKLTFTDPRIQTHFANMVLLQADVTANNEDDKALLKRFKLFGPPGIIFFGEDGREIQGGRVIGYQNADKFDRSLRLVMGF